MQIWLKAKIFRDILLAHQIHSAIAINSVLYTTQSSSNNHFCFKHYHSLKVHPHMYVYDGGENDKRASENGCVSLLNNVMYQHNSKHLSSFVLQM